MGAKKYVKEVIKEGKRVRWPKWDVFFPALVTVIIICVFAALVLSLEDFVAGSIVVCSIFMVSRFSVLFVKGLLVVLSVELRKVSC